MLPGPTAIIGYTRSGTHIATRRPQNAQRSQPAGSRHHISPSGYYRGKKVVKTKADE